MANGLAEPHHLLPDTGWVSLYLRETTDVDRALALFRRSFDLALKQKGLPGTASALSTE